MAVTAKDGKKWIQTGVALVCMWLGYIFIRFFAIMGEWFEIEAKFASYTVVSQVVAVLIGLSTFIYIIKNEKSSNFLADAYVEMMKVVWPDKNETVRHTVGIMIGVTIVGFMLGIFDFVASYLLSLIH